MSTEERVYRVEGMACGHCRASVAQEVRAVEGVTAVVVDLETGRLGVSGRELDDAAISAAVIEAGYEVRA
jgi:copper chaperone CopZ